MKAAAFKFLQPQTLDAALHALGEEEGARVAAGYQSLGPMLNLRLTQPALIVDITRIPELRAVEDTKDTVVYGTCVTHAEIEDGVVADGTAGALAAVAAGIAYRAVRNRGTIGGSIAHADPAADWVTALAAAGASVRLASPRGVRQMAVENFVRGAFVTALAEGEMVVAVEVPRFSPAARWGFWKFCRKVGEFAEAICAVSFDPERDWHRIVIGTANAKPIVLANAGDAFADPDALAGLLDGALSQSDAVQRRIQKASVRRSLALANGAGRGTG